jgi:hypothetical protein
VYKSKEWGLEYVVKKTLVNYDVPESVVKKHVQT